MGQYVCIYGGAEFSLWLFTLWTVFSEWILSVKWGVGVSMLSTWVFSIGLQCCLKYEVLPKISENFNIPRKPLALWTCATRCLLLYLSTISQTTCVCISAHVTEFWLFSLHHFHLCLLIVKWQMLRSKEFALNVASSSTKLINADHFFFDIRGIVHKEFVPPGQTVNGHFYCKVLRWLRENVRR